MLGSIERFGVKRLALLRQYVGLENAFTADGAYTPQLVAFAQQAKLTLPYPLVAQCEPTLKWLEAKENHLIPIGDPLYPCALSELSSPPMLLSVVGNIDLLSQPQMAMVGTRRPSQYGAAQAARFATDLSQQGFVITSGLALGIDGIAHAACLDAGGKTIAVMANGLDQIYPRRHVRLGRRIVAEGGALVSEFCLGVLPKPVHFPRRNRIISGLSLGVLVVEAAVESGSLITASYALEQGREVFACPGCANNSLSMGCHELIRQGAKIVDCVTHILEELPSSAATVQPPTRHSQLIELPDFVKFVDDVCTPIDLVIQRARLSAQEVTTRLMELELQGWISSVPGGYVRNNAGGMP